MRVLPFAFAPLRSFRAPLSPIVVFTHYINMNKDNKKRRANQIISIYKHLYEALSSTKNTKKESLGVRGEVRGSEASGARKDVPEKGYPGGNKSTLVLVSEKNPTDLVAFSLYSFYLLNKDIYIYIYINLCWKSRNIYWISRTQLLRRVGMSRIQFLRVNQF